MPEIDLNGSAAPAVAFAPPPAFVDGWPSGPHAILLELAALALFWFVLKHLFGSLSRRRHA